MPVTVKTISLSRNEVENLKRMLIYFFAVAGLLAASSALQAQVVSGSGGFDSGAASSDTYSLDGTVVNAVTGEAIGNALVQGSARAQLTGPDGTFHFTALPAGRYYLTVRKPGYFSEQDLNPGPNRPTLFQVGSSATATPAILKLMPESVLYGRITGVGGEPLENIPVRIFASRVVNGRRQWEQHAGDSTNEEGEFRIANLRPGTYYLRAGPGMLTDVLAHADTSSRRAGYPLTYYPDARDVQAAAPIELTPGQQYGVELSLQTTALYRIAGTVSGVPTREFAVSIQLLTTDGAALDSSVNFQRETGSFVMPSVPPGSYIAQATAWDPRTRQMLSIRLPLTVNRDVAGVALAPIPLLVIPINVTKQQTKSTPPAGLLQPRGQGSEQTVTVKLEPRDGSLLNRELWANFEGPNRGPYAVRNAQPGSYRVEIRALGAGWYVDSARCGRTDLLREELVIGHGAAIEPIEIVLRDDAASLQGKLVSNGQPALGTVLVIPSLFPQQVMPAYVQPDSTFLVSGLAPGEYSVFGFDSIADLQYTDPEAMREFSPGAQTLRLLPNQQATLNVELQHRQK